MSNMVSDYAGKKVLLLDGYGRQIPSLLHQLHQLGCKVTTMCESRLDVGYTSRYPSKRVVVHGIRNNKRIYQNAIEQELKNKYDILFPILERATDICTSGRIQKEYPELKIIAAPREAFLKAYDKQETMRVCMENNIPCPITKMENETLDQYLEKVSFPICAKPRKGSGGVGFKKIMNREELDKYIEKGIISVEEYVIQELIPKGGLQYGGYIMMNDECTPQSILVVESCRWFPIDGGPGCYIRTINHDGMINSTKRLFEKIKWKNFGHVGFIMDPRDNIPKVMEINGRIPASIKICELAGTEPVKNMLNLAYRKKIESKIKPIPENLILRYFHADLMWLIKNPNRWCSKPNWFDFRKNNDYIFSWTDPLPFFSYAIEHIITYKKDMAKRKHL